MKTQNMLDAYITCALWSSMDNSTESGGYPLEDNYGSEDIAPETLADMQSDCEDFQKSVGKDLALYLETQTVEQLGHDFWLTRNHHGAGFWDRGLGDIGDRLTEAAHVYGSVDLYIGDDGRVYQ